MAEGYGAEPGETFRVALGSRNGLFKGFMMRAEEAEADDAGRTLRGRERRAPRGKTRYLLIYSQYGLYKRQLISDI